MTRDFATRSRRHHSPRKKSYKSNVPAWVWLFTGSVIGAFIMFLVYLAGIPPQQGSNPGDILPDIVSSLADSESEPSVGDGDATEDKPNKTKFTFYELLKKNEVIVTEEPLDQTNDAQPEVQYILRVGYFRNPENADRARAQLILLNLDAWIEKGKTDNLETYYLVKVGPFATRAKRDSARSVLFDNGFESMVERKVVENE